MLSILQRELDAACRMFHTHGKLASISESNKFLNLLMNIGFADGKKKMEKYKRVFDNLGLPKE